jgi:hypothetical protein
MITQLKEDFTMPPIHRGDLVYVAYQPGDQPNSLRKWPQVHAQNYVGSAPEGAAMQIARATTVPVVVNGKRVNYANPYTESGGAIQWWYVRSFQGDPAASRGQVLNAWTAGYGPLGGQRKEFLLPLAQRLYACDEPQQAPLKSYLADGKRAYAATNRLQLLSGPGGGHEVLGYLAMGETLTVLGKPECDTHNRLWWQTDRHGWWVCETEQMEKGLSLNLAPLAV